MPDIILAAILLLPLASAYFLKTNGAIFFLTVCAGFVLVNLASSDIGNLLHRSNISSISSDTTNLLLVFVPAALSILLVRKGGQGKMHMVLSLIAALCGGALMVLTTAPFFGSVLPDNFSSTSVWTTIQKSQSWVISAGALASFIYVWLGASKRFGKYK